MTAPRSLRSLVLLLPILVLGVAAAAAPQEPPPAPPGGEPDAPRETVFESIQVNVVNIEVFVTDGRGRPITGLGRDDFELLVDGLPVAISNFYAAELPGPRTEAPAGRAPEGAAPPAAEARPAAEPEPAPEGPPLHLVIYVDNANLRPADRNRVLNDLGRFVSLSVPRGTQMMLVTYDHGLNVRQPFTADPRAILDVAAEVEGLAGNRVGQDADRRLAIDEIEEAKDDGQALTAAVSYAEARRVELAFPLDALTEIMEPLGGLPGRKALVYLSNGLPQRVGEDLFYMVDARFPRSRARLHAFNYDLAESYRRLIHAANAAGVTIYSLGAAGLSPFDSLSAEEGGSREGGSFVIVDSVRKANLETPLHRMSHETGGVALTNSNNTDLFFEQVAQDASAFYSLGYQAADTGSGRYRSVEVKVRRPGAKVRHRSGFRTRSPELRLEQGVMAALALGRAGESFPGVVTIGRPAQREDGLYAVPLSVKVPLDRVTLVPGEEIWVGRLRFAVQVRDQRGDFSPLNSGEPVDLRIPAGEVEQALGQHITWSVDLLMEAGNHALAVGLADLVADHLDFALGSVTVPSS